MTAPIIGIGGWMTAGKDALADFLVTDYGYGKTFMSEPLTAAVSLIGPRGPWVRLDQDIQEPDEAARMQNPGMDVGDWELFPTLLKTRHAGEFVRYADLVESVGYTAAKEHRDAREYLQGLGTEVGRNMMGEDVWAKLAGYKIQDLHKLGPVVITGIRYQNELDMLHELGGAGVWISRAGLSAPQSTHTSETSLGPEDFDLIVHNDGDLENDLRREATALHTQLSGR